MIQPFALQAPQQVQINDIGAAQPGHAVDLFNTGINQLGWAANRIHQQDMQRQKFANDNEQAALDRALEKIRVDAAVRNSDAQAAYQSALATSVPLDDAREDRKVDLEDALLGIRRAAEARDIQKHNEWLAGADVREDQRLAQQIALIRQIDWLKNGGFGVPEGEIPQDVVDATEAFSNVVLPNNWGEMTDLQRADAASKATKDLLGRYGAFDQYTQDEIGSVNTAIRDLMDSGKLGVNERTGNVNIPYFDLSPRHRGLGGLLGSAIDHGLPWITGGDQATGLGHGAITRDILRQLGNLNSPDLDKQLTAARNKAAAQGYEIGLRPPPPQGSLNDVVGDKNVPLHNRFLPDSYGGPRRYDYNQHPYGPYGSQFRLSPEAQQRINQLTGGQQ